LAGFQVATIGRFWVAAEAVRWRFLALGACKLFILLPLQGLTGNTRNERDMKNNSYYFYGLCDVRFAIGAQVKPGTSLGT